MKSAIRSILLAFVLPLAVCHNSYENSTTGPGQKTGTEANTGSGPLVALSPDRKYLIDAKTAKPFYIVGDAPQTLAVQVNDADMTTYLEDRAARGFNAIWVIFADGGTNCDQPGCPKNYYGVPPFNGADFTKENPAYWAHIDSVIQQAGSRGIVVWAMPMFVGVSGDYYHNSVLSTSDSKMKAYGAWLGARYKNYPNIVWLLGGDTDMSNAGLAQKMGDLAAGIAGSDPNHLMTLEPCRSGCSSEYQSSAAVWKQATPLTLNWVYPVFGASYSACAFNYATYPSLPIMMGEDWYEGDHSMTNLQLREEAWWESLSGCMAGRLFGNGAIWTMGGPHSTIKNTWQSQLGSPGSLTEQYLGKLMRSREFWLLVPDSSHLVLTGGVGSGTSISAGACTSDGQTCIIYDPVGNAQPPQIAMSHFSGTVHAWWFNPSTAETINLRTFRNKGTHTFMPRDGNDWVLVLDLDSAGLPAPGGSS